jgi:hypothetical protein
MLGTWFRLYPPFNAGFPIGDGGLFAAMIEALHQNHYHIPEFVQYNGLAIPFAYPPLGFFIAGLGADIFHSSILNSLHWLPAVVLIITIPAVYFLAGLLLKSKLKAGLAALFYALLPGSVAWLIMGGGITRSFGQLFLILAAANIYLLFTTEQRKYIAYSILFSGLVCLSHPEAAVHTSVFALTLWLFYGRNKAGLMNALTVAFGTMLITSPWWIIILSRFGLSPYLSAFQTGSSEAVALLAPFISFSQEAFLPILAMLGILGIAVSIAKREYLLPALYILPFLVEPRDATNVYIIPLALLASVAVCDILLPVLSKTEAVLRQKEYSTPLQSYAERFIFSYILICLLLGAQISSVKFSEKRVSPEIRSAFEWIKSNTPKESSFIILTGITGQLNDYVNEWFPELTNRRSATTIQGLEWMGDHLFTEYRPAIADIQTCRAATKIMECVEANPSQLNFKYDYIVITADSSQPALKDLSINNNYKTIYSSEDVLILEELPAAQP